MGLAALFVGGLIALAIAAAILYGTFVGLARLGRFLWPLLVVPEARGGALGPLEEVSPAVPCWQEKDCPPPVRESCPAYLQKDGLPCWLANLRAEGRLRVSCLTCHCFNMAALVA